jgi:hypothetical protein
VIVLKPFEGKPISKLFILIYLFFQTSICLGQANSPTVEFEIKWLCLQSSLVGKAVPEKRQLKFIYGLKNNNTYFSSNEFDEFINKVSNIKTNITSCLSDFSGRFRYGFLRSCKTFESERGKNEINCEKKLFNKFAKPLIDKINIVHSQMKNNKNIRLPILVGQPLTNNNNQYDENEANWMVRKCRFKRYGYFSDNGNNFTSAISVISALEKILQENSHTISKECRIGILKNYIKNIIEQQLSYCDDFTSEEPLICKQIREASTSSLDRLKEVFSKEMEIYEGEEKFSTLNQLYLQLNLSNKCIKLKVGESRIINMNNIESPTGLATKYKLERSSESTHRVEVNIFFSPAVNRAEMVSRTKKCFKKLDKQLVGPFQERIQLALSSDRSAPQVDINIIDGEFRSNSANWKRTASCATIIHETLHLLGLVDEYSEKNIGHSLNMKTKVVRKVNNLSEVLSGETFISQYDCRVSGPTGSIMNNSHSALKSKDNFLLSAHFKAITQPGCFENNKIYYQCAPYAYKTSKEHYGNGCGYRKPDVCDDQGDWVDN